MLRSLIRWRECWKMYKSDGFLIETLLLGKPFISRTFRNVVNKEFIWRVTGNNTQNKSNFKFWSIFGD